MAEISKIIDIKIKRGSCRGDHSQTLIDAIYAAVGDEPNPTRWALEGFPMEQIKLIIKTGVNLDYCFIHTPLGLAARYGLIDLAKVLVEAGANINGRNIVGFTPIMLATIGAPGEVFDYLIEQGADLGLKDYSGKTALIIAIEAMQAAPYGETCYSSSEPFKSIHEELIRNTKKLALEMQGYRYQTN